MRKSLIDSRSILIAFIAAALIGFTLLGYRYYADRNQGQALIGGHFELIDQDGKKVADNNFRGKYMLVFFGYTSCPDICPITLQTISGALDELGEKAKDIQPIFISIDPLRDNVSILKDYISHFHSRFIALTGSKEEIEQASKAYRVFYQSNQNTGLIDHSSVIYLMDKKGRYLQHFPADANQSEIVKGLIPLS